MAWSTLADRLNTLPYVLAGPILRKVTPKSVTVWLALRMASKVILTVQDDQQNKVRQGTGDTIAIGKNLHIVAVTAATPLPPWGDLTEGIVYRYDLEFPNFPPTDRSLFLATRHADLGYPSHPSLTLPSFSLPPKDPNLLRLIQGSCRMPHAEGKDTFPLVDDLIAETAANAFARPHQLLLTGDQIYADDVADAMLFMLMDAANTLLGWEEELPLPDGPAKSTELPPACLRSFLLEPFPLGFTSVDLKSHLMSLGEYLAMYLFVWSEVLWPVELDGSSSVTTLPSFAQIAAKADASVRRRDRLVYITRFRNSGSIEKNTKAVAEFRNSLSKVRRVLANIPSYMIFDDHEVTDDWNMTLDYCRLLYGSALGVRITQNALVAYALCQHWGNVPEEFDDPKPGRALLELLDTPSLDFNQKAVSYGQNSARIRALLGLQELAAIRQHKAVYHDPGSLQYHFTVESPGHQVIFTDTRTWRSFPHGGNEPAELLPKDQIKQQILNTPDLITPLTPDRVLIVVLSTNAPPVGPIRSAARHALVARAAKMHPDVYEAWEIPSVPFDRLLTALTDKLPVVSRQLYGRVILLSGDVHHSFASRLVYHADVRFEDQQPPKRATAVFAQLVASSFKKQTEDTVGFHSVGYRYSPAIARFLGFIPAHQPEGYVGWNVAPGSGRVIGKKTRKVGRFEWSEDLELDQPTVPLQEENPGIDITVQLSDVPDYRYRLDYLIASREGFQPTRPEPISLPSTSSTPEERKEAAKKFNRAHADYRHYNKGIESKQYIVGVNNFGEITFKWGTGEDKKVNHTLRWYDIKLPPLVTWTTYTVSLNPTEFEDLTPPVRP